MNAANWDRVKQIFQDALERPLADRARYVREQCGEERELQAEVESLLATHQDAGSFAARPAEELLDGLATGPTGASGTSQGPGMSPGDRLGVYEIQSLIGVGGMGEVYKARDTRLDRTVAIKVLPTHLAADRERYERFEREARAVASLDHPHIGALYDVGEHDGVSFLVMQYLDGETLAARLARGAVPLDQALRYAIDLADALDHAHRRGIVHRDVKPGNIVLTKAGATLLDFGLAKWRPAPATAGAAPPAQRAIALDSLTEKGLLVGTLHYMAPEQLEGRPVDARTDLFAFGAVVYEIVSGKKAFDGGSSANVIAAILDTQPTPLSTLQPTTLPALIHVVETCLAKDPDTRWQSAGDVARELRWIAESRAELSANGPLQASGRSRRTLAIVLAAFVSGASVAFIISRTSVPATILTRVTRTAIPLPSGASFWFGSTSSLALSPDGKYLAYVVARGGAQQVYIRALDELEAKVVPGSDDGSGTFFSPDSRWLGFATRGKLMKVALNGSAPQPKPICEVQMLFGATWGPDDEIIFSDGSTGGLSRVPASGGTPRTLTTPDRGKHEKSHRFPRFLPDGKAVVFTLVSADISSFDEASVAVLSLDSGQIRTLPVSGTSPVFVPTGHLVYVRGASLMAAPFNPRTQEITGPSATILEDVIVDVEQGPAAFSIENGSLAYLHGKATSDSVVHYVDRQGRSSPVFDGRRQFEGIKLSPDGKRLALGIGGANDQVWLYDFARRTMSRVTFGWDNYIDGWTPDGERLTILSDRDGGPYLFFWQAVESSAPAERLTDQHSYSPGSWSPDGKLLAFAEFSPVTRLDIWLLSLGPERTTRPLIQTPFRDYQPSFSPDGRWLAYVSDESGRDEVYVQPFPALGAKWPLSTDGGASPVWARNGRELFYENGRKLMVVSIRTDPTFVAAEPRLLFDRPYELDAYDVSPDGRFIMIEPAEPDNPVTQITLVQNWLDELKHRVPTLNSPAK